MQCSVSEHEQICIVHVLCVCSRVMCVVLQCCKCCVVSFRCKARGSLTSKVRLLKLAALNHRAHGAIHEHDALPQRRIQFVHCLRHDREGSQQKHKRARSAAEQGGVRVGFARGYSKFFFFFFLRAPQIAFCEGIEILCYFTNNLTNYSKEY